MPKLHKKGIKSKKMCWCGEHEEFNMADFERDMDKLIRKSVVEFKKPRKDGAIGTLAGFPIYIKK